VATVACTVRAVMYSGVMKPVYKSALIG
jgi:hypothetical protein